MECRRPYPSPAPRASTPRPDAEIGLTIAGALLVLPAWFGLYPFVLLPGLVYATVIVAALGAVTAARWYRAGSARSTPAGLT